MVFDTNWTITDDAPVGPVGPVSPNPATPEPTYSSSIIQFDAVFGVVPKIPIFVDAVGVGIFNW